MKIVGTSIWFRVLVLAVMSGLPAGILWPVGSASAQPPLFQGSFACPAGAPTGETVGNGLLGSLTTPFNNTWMQTLAPGIKEATITKTDIHVPDGCANGGSSFCTASGFGGCSFVFVDITVNTIDLSIPGVSPSKTALQFTSLSGGADQRNVAAHTNRGSDASVITDGIFGPEGSNAADPAYAVVVPFAGANPHNGVNGAIVIDLGTKADGTLMTLCGVSSTCPAPKIQADNDEIYQFDYSTDGISWTVNSALQFPTPNDSGLRTRSLTNSKAPASFTARYVRVYGVLGTGGSNWSISELQLWDTDKNLVSVGKPATGPSPYVIFDGQFANPGAHSNDSTVAVVLTHKAGSGTALMIDLGKVYPSICGNNGTCSHPPKIQADNDDTYMFDYSVDGKNWTTYGYVDTPLSNETEGDWHGTFDPCCDEGLQSRDMSCSASTNPIQPPPSVCSPNNGGFSARYIRVYARTGGDTFAVSEVSLWDTAGNPVPATKQAFGPEPFFINGEFAPEGTSADENGTNTPVWITKLGACSSNGTPINNSKCPAAAPGTPAPVSAAKQIDLTAVFPISALTIQADNNDTYQVDGSSDGVNWTPLWTVPKATSNGSTLSGLRTRSVTIPSQPTIPSLPQARYVRVYATAGDGKYSVSELQVFTPQANTAGSYGIAVDSDGFFSSRGANDGQNFVCSYEGPVQTALGVDYGDGTGLHTFGFGSGAACSQSTPCTTAGEQCWNGICQGKGLPINFFVTTVSLNARCDIGGSHNIASASNRQCSMTLMPPQSYAPPFTDHFQAGICAGNAPAILSYVQYDDDPSESQSAIQFVSKDQPVPYPSGRPSDLNCSDFGSLDAHIPDVLRGFVPEIVAGVIKSAVNQTLDYRENKLVPFPRVQSGQTTVPVSCPATGEGEPPAPAPDNIRALSGRATGVGGGRGSATLRVSGRFTAEHAVALDQAALTVHSLLEETGVTEVVEGEFPLTLQPLNGSKADKGLYRTPSGVHPIISARVAPVKGSRDGSMDFEIEVKNATIREPADCRDGLATAPLKTSFQIVGGSAEPIWVHAEAEWQCNDAQLLTP